MPHAEQRTEVSLFWVLLYLVTFPLISAQLSIVLFPFVVLFLFIPAKSSKFYNEGNPTVKSRYLAQK